MLISPGFEKSPIGPEARQMSSIVSLLVRIQNLFSNFPQISHSLPYWLPIYSKIFTLNFCNRVNKVNFSLNI
jgi:hypothetical protein